MKHLLLTTIAAALLVATTAFADPIHDAVFDGVIARVQAELDKGVDVNTEDDIHGVAFINATPCVLLKHTTDINEHQ